VVSVTRNKQGDKKRYNVYNIEVEGNHNYFANGILVGNCHFLKSPSAKRTAPWLGPEGFAEQAKHVIALSGTPIPNNPLEVHQMLRVLSPETMGAMSRDTFKALY
jgi:hypothetical protein